MRVITGLAKGHKLKAPKGIKTRPTTDRIKETIFNIVNVYPDDIVLDLFSGSGSIGIEFLSRGAKKCFFVDNDISSHRIIIENLKKTKLYDKSEVYKIDYESALNSLYKKEIKFHYIYLDPPYNKNLIAKSINKIREYNILAEDGVIIAEHEKRLELSEFERQYTLEIRNFGESSVTFLKNKEK